MKGRNGIRMAMLAALLVIALAVLSACGGGVSQEDYDAAIAARDAAQADLSAAQQQVTSLEQQLQPTAPREPKRLEAKITIEMGETPNDMFFTSPEGVKGGPFRLPADKTVGMHFVNKGEKLHEFMFGRMIMSEDGRPHGYMTSLFEGVAADLFVYSPLSGKMVMVEIGGAEFEEIEVDPGAEVWLRTTFPAELKGEWEIGCFVQEPDAKGHYDQGMHAKLIIE